MGRGGVGIGAYSSLSGRLFETARLLTFTAFRIGALIRGGH